MLRLERLVAPARRAEQRFELRREDRAERRFAVLPRHLHALRPVPEVRKIELETAVVFELNERLDLAHEPRLAVRREAHHLEFVAVVGKPEVLRDGEIQQPQRVGEEHAPVDGQTRAGHAAPGRADEVAEAVDRADRRLVERRRRTRRWRGAPGGARRIARAAARRASSRSSALAIVAGSARRLARLRARDATVPFGRCLSRNSALRHRCARGSRDTANTSTSDGARPPISRQTASPGAETPRMLDAPEPLFLHRRDELSVADQRRRHVAVIRVEAEDVHRVSDTMRFRYGDAPGRRAGGISACRRPRK